MTAGERRRAVAFETTPDLELLVSLEERDGGPTLTYRLNAPRREEVNQREFPPLQLPAEPQAVFEEHLRQLEKLSPADFANPDEAEGKIDATCSFLAQKLLPEPLRELLWELWESADEAPTLLVQSPEDWIPWEVLKLRRRKNGRWVEGPFLCEAFALSRWRPGFDLCFHLPLQRLALLVPEGSGLAEAAEEGREVEAQLAEKRTVRRIESLYGEVVDHLAAGRFDGWHFAGHGTTGALDPNLWAIELEDGEKLRPLDLHGKAGGFARARPLVFFNGCHTGRSARSLTGVGGWADQWLTLGAGAFLGASWSTFDEPARDFASAFYEEFIGGNAFAEAVRRARLAVRKAHPGNPTRLAYVAFAHPLARCAKRPRTVWPRLLKAAAALVAVLVVAWSLRGWRRAEIHQRALAYNDQGVELLLEDRLAEARQAFLKARDVDPGFVEAIANLAALEGELGYEDEAAKGYQQAIELDGENADYPYNLGTLRVRQGYLGQAVESLKRAVELRPGFAEAWNELGNAYLGMDRPDLAREVLETGLNVQEPFPDGTRAALHKNLARALLREDGEERARSAVRHLHDAQSFYEADAWGLREATFLLARAYDRLGEPRQACEQLRALERLLGSETGDWVPEARTLGERSGCPVFERP